MSRIRKSFPLPLFRYGYIFFFCAYHFSIATCPFVVIAYHLLRQGWLRTVRGNLTTTFISIFVLCFPSLALMTTMDEALESLRAKSGSRSFRMSRDVANIVADSSDAVKSALGNAWESVTGALCVRTFEDFRGEKEDFGEEHVRAALARVTGTVPSDWTDVPCLRLLLLLGVLRKRLGDELFGAVVREGDAELPHSPEVPTPPASVNTVAEAFAAESVRDAERDEERERLTVHFTPRSNTQHPAPPAPPLPTHEDKSEDEKKDASIGDSESEGEASAPTKKLTVDNVLLVPDKWHELSEVQLLTLRNRLTEMYLPREQGDARDAIKASMDIMFSILEGSPPNDILSGLLNSVMHLGIRAKEGWEAAQAFSKSMTASNGVSSDRKAALKAAAGVGQKRKAPTSHAQGGRAPKRPRTENKPRHSRGGANQRPNWFFRNHSYAPRR